MSNPSIAPGTPNVEEAKRRLREEIKARLSLDSGVANDDARFWKEVGLRYQIADPTATTHQLALTVLAKLGAGEDERPDFVEEGGTTVALAAYEWLVDKLSKSEDEDEAEDEDEEFGALAREQQILVSNQDNPIQSIVSFIEDGTIVLDPDWQRGYVWKQRQKRRLVESIFLSLPIPPVLLFQDSKDKKMYVIDGRQRLETVYRFHLGSKQKKESFRTYSSKQPGWGPGEKLNPAANKHFDKLPPDLQRHFNTFVIPARVFMNLPRRTLYEVFARYNTGSEKLRPAEIRKAVYQGAKLHEMMFQLAGESGIELIADPREKDVASELEATMRNKKARYGAYNFVGRCLAFAHISDELSVANAINRFMDDFSDEDPEKFRSEFIDAFEATLRLYDGIQPLCVADASGDRIAFHEWVATIQIVSTIEMLEHIRAGEITEDAVRDVIQKEWKPFIYGTFNAQANANVGGLLQDKQNTTTHWARQREWIRKLTEGVGLKSQIH